MRLEVQQRSRNKDVDSEAKFDDETSNRIVAVVMLLRGVD